MQLENQNLIIVFCLPQKMASSHWQITHMSTSNQTTCCSVSECFSVLTVPYFHGNYCQPLPEKCISWHFPEWNDCNWFSRSKQRNDVRTSQSVFHFKFSHEVYAWYQCFCVKFYVIAAFSSKNFISFFGCFFSLFSYFHQRWNWIINFCFTLENILTILMREFIPKYCCSRGA